MVGLVIEVPLEDAGMEHRLRAEVINRHGTVLATLDNTFRVSDAGLFPHEVQQVPLVLSITGVRARTWGTHQVRLYLDEDLVRALTLYVVPAAAPQGARTPTQSRVADDEGSLGGTGDEGRPEPAEFPADPEEPAAADREAAEDDEGRRASVSWGEPSEPGPEPDIGLDLDPELDLEIEPSRQPTPAPASAFRSASIAAAPAREEDPTTAAVPQVFDFDDEDDEGPAKREAEGAAAGLQPVLVPLPLRGRRGLTPAGAGRPVSRRCRRPRRAPRRRCGRPARSRPGGRASASRRPPRGTARRRRRPRSTAPRSRPRRRPGR